MKPEIHPDLHETARKARLPDGSLWVFGYGSLMWDPGLKIEKLLPGRVYGYHRRFCLRSMEAWGTAEQPGLCATLHPGGSTAGRAMLLADRHFHEGLSALGVRESAYLPRHVRIHLRSGGRIDGLTFVFDETHPRAAGDMILEEQLALFRQGEGSRGCSAGYLDQVVKVLRADGSKDQSAEILLHHVGVKDSEEL